MLINAGTSLGGTQFTVNSSGNVTAAGSLSGTRLISTVATGTALLQVASTTVVPNLNASLLGGSAASAFAAANGSPNYIQNRTTPQPGTNFNISGNGTLGGMLNANGGVSAGGLGVASQINGNGSNNSAMSANVNVALSGSSNTGVSGSASNTSGGVNTGVSGTVNGNTGVNTGVSGSAMGTGQSTGVSGTTFSDAKNSVGVSGGATSTTGVVFGVVGIISTTADKTAGVVGLSQATTGFNTGVAGIGNSSAGTGGYFQNQNTQAGSLLIDAVDANAAQRFTVDNLGNIKVTTGTTTLVTVSLPVNHARTTMTLTNNVTYNVTFNWAYAFSDTNYTATCTPQLASGGPQIYLLQVSATTTTSVTVDVAASGPFPGQLTIHCMGVHD